MTRLTAVNAPATTFEIEPIGPTIGAEIHGLDLARPPDAKTFSALEAALTTHKVVYLRDQHIGTAQHVAAVDGHDIPPKDGRTTFSAASGSTCRLASCFAATWRAL